MSRICAVVALALLATGCGGSRAASVAKGPEAGIPPSARPLAAPSGYRVKRVWRAELTPGRSYLVVSSVGPRSELLGQRSAKSMDLRVLQREPGSGHWRVRFDAQRAPAPSDSCAAGSQDLPACYPGSGGEDLNLDAPMLLSGKADVSLGPVRFAHLLSKRYDDLIFSAANYAGGSGMPMVLAVVDFRFGPQVEYSWSGEGLWSWHVAHRKLYGKASFWTWNDAHCCPIRAYRFAVAPRGGEFVETSDNRPWLGVTARERTYGSGPLKVVGIAPYSPARRALRVGDELLRVLDAPRPPYGGKPPPGFFDRLNLFRPGQVVRLLVKRGGAKITVSVKVGSLKDSIPQVFRFDSPLVDL